MTNTKNEITAFFLRHPEYFLKVVSLKYPFSNRQLADHKDMLNWEIVSQNESINWDHHLLSAYQNILDWDIISTNCRAFNDVALIDKFNDRIAWEGHGLGSTIASNEGVAWSCDLIEKYESKLDFAELSSNAEVPWSERLIDKYGNRWDFSLLSENHSLPWSVDFFEK